MAKIASLTGEIELVISPDRVVERGTPTWVLTRLAVRRSDTTLLSATVNMTLGDFAELREGVGLVLAGLQPSFRIRGSDEDFGFDAEAYDMVESFFISIWTGEPNSLMQGYRFMVLRSTLSQFLTDLGREESSLNAGTGSSLS